MTYSLILRRTLLAASAAALCLPAMAELADIKAAGKLRVGIDFGAPFYGYVDDKMKPVGSDVEAAELRRRVTSPNGTTEAAIKTFQAGGFEALVQLALDAAARRSAELAEQLGQ